MQKPIFGVLALFGLISIPLAAPHAFAAPRAHHAAKTPSLAAYFPLVKQYASGYKPLAIQQFGNPSQLFAAANLSQATRYHFVSGAMQTALGPRNTVVTVIIARFRDQAEARHFRTVVRPDVIGDGSQKTGVLHGLGSNGARYESGNCASCGPGAPSLDQVFFSRGPMFVEISSQPTNQGLAKQLGTVIDAKLKRSQVR